MEDCEIQDREGNDEIGEDAILESLFVGCDTEGTGLVQVSRLVEYLSLTVTGDNVDFGGNFNHLTILLDPDGRDVYVDMTTYSNGMRDWIDGIRDEKFGDTSVEKQNTSCYVDCQEIAEEVIETSQNENESRIEENNSKNYSSESVEGVGGESPEKQEWELVAQVEDLQLNNKRLVEHNTELSFQMENTEETNTQLLQELTELQKLLRSYQCLDEKNKALERENEELQQTVSELQESNKEYQTRAKHLEKDKLVLKETQDELKTKLSTVSRKLESLSLDHKTVCFAYNEEKQRLVELEELQEEKKLRTPTDSQEYLRNVIVELTAQKEALQISRTKMEAELSKVRDELNHVTMHSSSTVSLGTRSVHATPAGKPVFLASSLQQEIQEMSFDDYLPSPLIGYSKHAFNESYESDVFESSLDDVSSTSLNTSQNSSLGSVTSNDALTHVSQVAIDFRDKKDRALQTISELVHLEKTKETRGIREGLQSELEKELEFFSEKLQMMSHSQQVAEKRVLTLLDSIGTLKDQNKQFMEERNRVIETLDSLSIGTGDCLETRMNTVKSKLDKAQDKVKMLEKRCLDLQHELNATKTELKDARSENGGLVSSLNVERNNRRQSENKLQELEKFQSSLINERDNTLDKLSKLEGEVERTKSDLDLEKKRSFGLEESLSFSVSKHEDELQDIFEEIPDASPRQVDNVNRWCRPIPPVINAHQVKSKLRELLANRHLTVRVSPEGKQTTREDEPPLYASTPIDTGYIQSRHSSQDRATGSSTCYDDCSVSPSLSANKDRLNTSQDRTWSSAASSIVSPNLVEPFQSEDEFSQSPSYVNPFQKKSPRSSVTKPNNTRSRSPKARTKLATSNALDSRSINSARSIDDTNNANTDNSLGNTNRETQIPTEYVGILTPFTPANQNLVFTFDTVDVEQSVPGSSRLTVGGRLTYSSQLSDRKVEESGSSKTGNNVEGISLSSNVPSDERELESLFKDVSQAFRADKSTLHQRLESRERDRDDAEENIAEGLQTLRSGIQSLEKCCVTKNSKNVLKDSLDSLCQQISLLKESSKHVSSKSRQLGCVQQEARMMCGVDVLINYGESISQRFTKITKTSESCVSSEKQGASCAEQSKTCGSDQTPCSSMTEEMNTSQGECREDEPSRKKCDAKRLGQRVKNSLWWSVRLVVFVVLFAIFVSFGLRYSTIDRDFVVLQLQRNLKRFEVKHFGHEPAV